MKQQKQWRELTTATKVRIGVLAVVQMTLLAAALWDIRHRPAEGIKGSKKMWIAIAFVNFVGPLAYFFFGRKAFSTPHTTQVATE